MKLFNGSLLRREVAECMVGSEQMNKGIRIISDGAGSLAAEAGMGTTKEPIGPV